MNSFASSNAFFPSGRPLVYLAEDDQELRRLLAEGLRRAGYDVFSTSSGVEMLQLLGSASRGEVRGPDAIVLDVRMPQCSGVDVLDALRLASWKQPIVMITGFGDAALHGRTTQRGASLVLDKPFELSELTAVLDLLLLFDEHDDETAIEPTNRHFPALPVVFPSQSAVE